jgi:hypothetical protein
VNYNVSKAVKQQLVLLCSGSWHKVGCQTQNSAAITRATFIFALGGIVLGNMLGNKTFRKFVYSDVNMSP